MSDADGDDRHDHGRQPDPDPDADTGLGPVPWWFLTATAVIGFGLGWALELVTVWLNGSAPTIPLTTLAVLAVLALLVAFTAWQTHRQLRVERRALESRRALNLVLMAKAAALMGAFVAGGYVGFGWQFIDSFDVALPRERVINSAVAALLGVAVMGAGKALERVCRLPDDDDDGGESPSGAERA